LVKSVTGGNGPVDVPPPEAAPPLAVPPSPPVLAPPPELAPPLAVPPVAAPPLETPPVAPPVEAPPAFETLPVAVWPPLGEGSAPPDAGRPPDPGAPPVEGAGALSLEQCIRKRTEGRRLEAMTRFRSERCFVVMSCRGKRLGVA
jgi:hypothetical protein